MTEKIIDRIRKMLALANDLAATEGERDNALRMAYATMAKYNIDEALVAKSKEQQEARINFENQTFSWKWARDVNSIIARMFFCKLVMGRKINGTQTVFHFLGKESNAMTAAVMADWIVKSILKEARKSYKDNTCPETRSFAVGAMYRLQARIEEMQKTEAASQSSESRALVLVSLMESELKENEEFMYEQFKNLRTARAVAHSKIDGGAYRKGQEFGDKINLNKQVGATNKSVGSLN